MRAILVCTASILIAALSTYRYYGLLNALKETHEPIEEFLARKIEGVPVMAHLKTDALTVFNHGGVYLVCGYASAGLSSAPEERR
ncbi:MAG: hypothetical protein GTO54_11605, partial [Nitrososphaeria archaeon]|nr:hypothetical protein [Nitrososphaeria archaeon]